MTTVGFSPLEVLTAATSDSARSCRIDGETGSLVEGKRGDVIVIDGDPSADITAMWNVAEVFQDGAKVDRGNFV
jgi:imidazolonepropionase-like amidohydrolase